MTERALRAQGLGVVNGIVACVSALAYVGHGLVWAENVWGRVPDPPAWFSRVIVAYYGTSLALAVVLLLAGMGLWDGHRWGYWGSYLYCAGTLFLQASLFALGLLFAPQRTDWRDVLGVGMVVSGAYAVVLLAVLLYLRRGK